MVQAKDVQRKLYARAQLLGNIKRLVLLLNTFALRIKSSKQVVLRNLMKIGYQSMILQVLNGSKNVEIQATSVI